MKIVQKSDFPDATFEVSIVGATNTAHIVHLTEDYYQQLTNGDIEPEELVRRSFEFLLKKEPNTAILSDFKLKRIQQYFPDFEETMVI